MRRATMISLSAFTVLAACSAPDERRESGSMETMDVAEGAPPPPADARMAPGISVTAAPGVAFNYNYAFRLPNARISAVQEAHAQACEKLGIDRCRITGMRYTVRDEDDISAMLAFKLDPGLARAFGKDGIAAIEKAEGMLVDAEITGTDAGGAITQSQRDSDRLRARLTEIDAQLRQAGRRAEERTELAREAADLRARLAAASSDRDAARASLATTPMVFAYNSGNAISGNPLRGAFTTASAAFITILSGLIVVIGVLLPWLILGGLAWLALRPLWRRWRRSEMVASTPALAPQAVNTDHPVT